MGSGCLNKIKHLFWMPCSIAHPPSICHPRINPLPQVLTHLQAALWCPTPEGISCTEICLKKGLTPGIRCLPMVHDDWSCKQPVRLQTLLASPFTGLRQKCLCYSQQIRSTLGIEPTTPVSQEAFLSYTRENLIFLPFSVAFKFSTGRTAWSGSCDITTILTQRRPVLTVPLIWGRKEFYACWKTHWGFFAFFYNNKK